MDCREVINKYDSENRLIEEDEYEINSSGDRIFGNGIGSMYQYDNNGNLIRESNDSPQIIHYTYNNLQIFSPYLCRFLDQAFYLLLLLF